VADRERPVILAGRDDEDAIRAAHLAAAVGITNLGGYLSGGMTSWRDEKRPTEAIERLDVSGLHDRFDEIQVLDVRELSEWETGRIPGSLHTPYHDLDRIPTGIDVARPVAAICSSGQRAATAASLLARLGACHIIHIVDGGVGTWRERGWLTEVDDRRASAR
jgi:hydroxyacylglutathione hydrolase